MSKLQRAQGILRQRKLLVAFACLVFAALLTLFLHRSRQPKLFFISSTTSTTILTTATLCYVASTTTAMLTCKRKRRAIVSQGDTDSSITDIQPMKISSSKTKTEEVDEDAERDGRWLNYWITTTITTMTTSFTATETIASVICTPYGYTVNACPSG